MPCRLFAALVAAVCLAGLLVPAPSGAASALERAMALYRAGAFEAAAAAGRALGGADGHSLAARATLVRAAYVEDEPDVRRALFARAEADARAALAHDSEHVDALLQQAVALGYRGELMDPLAAHVDGYGHRGKALLDRALALDPGSPWVLGLSGIWHLRVVGRGGPELAASLYGAQADLGRDLCAEARQLGPEVMAVRLGCAIALFELDPARHVEAVRSELAAILALSPADAADRLIQAEARAELEALDRSPD